jgi:hypothetical protein
VTTGSVVVEVTTGSLSVVEVAGLLFFLTDSTADGTEVAVFVTRFGACVAAGREAAGREEVVEVSFFFLTAFFGTAFSAAGAEVAEVAEVAEPGGWVGAGEGADSPACDAAANPMTTVAARPATASPEVTTAAVRCALWRWFT